jgi:hypothetical protein
MPALQIVKPVKNLHQLSVIIVYLVIFWILQLVTLAALVDFMVKLLTENALLVRLLIV